MVWLYKSDSVRIMCIHSITIPKKYIDLNYIFTNDNDLQSHSHLRYYYPTSNKTVNLLDLFYIGTQCIS